MNVLNSYRSTGNTLVNMLTKTNAQQSVILSVIVSVVGGLLGGWLLALMFEIDTINASDFSLPSLFVPFLGAIFLIMVFNFLRST